jgi:Ca2+-binding EF-hand superfamily protein
MDLCKDIDKNNDKIISKEEFAAFMKDFLRKCLFEQENDMEHMRKLFLEADVDHSGFLSVDEIYNLFNLKLDMEVR